MMMLFYQLHHKLISNPRGVREFEILWTIGMRTTLEWSYNIELFKVATIKMMDSFEFSLRELVKDPEVLIGTSFQWIRVN